MPATDRIHAVVFRGEDRRASGVLSLLGADLVPWHSGLGLSGNSLHRYHLYAEVIPYNHPNLRDLCEKHEENVYTGCVPHCACV